MAQKPWVNKCIFGFIQNRWPLKAVELLLMTLCYAELWLRERERKRDHFENVYRDVNKNVYDVDVDVRKDFISFVSKVNIRSK